MAYIYGHPAPSWKMVAPDGRATALLATALPHRRLLLYFQKYLPAPPNFPSSHLPRLPIAVPNFPRHITFSAVLKVPFSLLVSFGFRAGFVRVSCRVSPKLHLTPNRAVLSCSLSSRVRESGQSSPLLAPQSPWSACGGGSACLVLLSSVLS